MQGEHQAKRTRCVWPHCPWVDMLMARNALWRLSKCHDNGHGRNLGLKHRALANKWQINKTYCCPCNFICNFHFQLCSTVNPTRTLLTDTDSNAHKAIVAIKATQTVHAYTLLFLIDCYCNELWLMQSSILDSFSCRMAFTGTVFVLLTF